MIQRNLYIYIGVNGTITSGVLLEGVPCVKKCELSAAAGKMLTNGSKVVRSITIPASELDEWYEIDVGQ